MAYSKVCTHAGCPVGLYQADSHELLCPCHQSRVRRRCAAPSRRGGRRPAAARSCRWRWTTRASSWPPGTSPRRSARRGGAGRDAPSLPSVGWLADVAAGGAQQPSALDPRRTRAPRTIADVWWLLFWTALVVLVVMLAFIVVGGAAGPPRTHRRASEVVERRAPLGSTSAPFITIGGVIVPGAHPRRRRRRDRRLDHERCRPRRAEPVHIDVIGADWCWRVQLPGPGVTTANEIHVPVGRARRDRARVGQRDPQLLGAAARRQDRPHPRASPTPPRFTADERRAPTAASAPSSAASSTPTWRSSSEPCPTGEFDAWLDARRAAPAGPDRRGAGAGPTQRSRRWSCAGCHTVAGTSGDGHGRPRPHRRRLAAGRSAAGTIAEHARRARPLDHRHARRQARQPDAADRS